MTTKVQPVMDGASMSLNIDGAYRLHAVDCYRFALRIVRDRDLAHDVVQDVFESLVRDPGRFEPNRGPLLTWLMTLTHHRAVDVVRWRHRHARLDLGDVTVVELVDPSLTPEDVAVRETERERIRAALGQLNSSEREVLVLAHFGGYSQTEIAQHMGVPLGTVKSQTRGGMRRMRLHLEVG